jgi:hypothetical protein
MRSTRTLFILLVGLVSLSLAAAAFAELPAGLAGALTVVAQAQPPADPPPADPPAADPQAPPAAQGGGGGVNWLWIAIGAVVLVAIVAILASTRGGSTTVVKETTRTP